MLSDSRLPKAMAVALCASLVATLAACAGHPPPEPVAPVVVVAPAQPASAPAAPASAPASTPVAKAPKAPDPVPELMAYAERVRVMSANDIALEITRLNDAANAADGSVAQVELALALLQTRIPADTARAMGLLQRASAPAADQSQAVAPFARVLAARAGEQRRLEDTVDRQNQQLRDSQRRIDQLNERLEAMRAIERSLTARPAGQAASAPNHNGSSGSNGATVRVAP